MQVARVKVPTVTRKKSDATIELMINKLHGWGALWWLSVSLWRICITFFDQVEYFTSIKLCQALSRQGAKIKIPVVRCHYLLCSAGQFHGITGWKKRAQIQNRLHY
jgi:hypothetical protein